ncbi:hypothetical protein F4V57_12080 [Acinetobacter qingfengensis]|uniref:Uncharacterized protein n=1 Tax=Acinetobacter qingfengensis TaxID=1262585 RepID=A0A1E7QXP7_9GAMM|nr:YcxB family protein [Acinetobacter qingfengensis]KAA8731721.1 hypothetical protein F4V57_12080 [Acinetobacter qingfengensis]OEY91821.1 hypothetical protein BJI46_06335 [Acinetobacter qingfengensis]
MTDANPSFSCRYFLTLDEAKEGFALATFGKKRFTQYITPILSILIIIWGLSLGLSGVGKFYVILGATFLILQLLLRFVLLPKLFTRQYQRYKFGETEQGIDLYQQHAVILVAGNEQIIQYTEIAKFAEAKQAYLIELKNKTVIIISKKAVEVTGQKDFFESVFKAYKV